MQQYLDLLKAIKDKGTYKPAARANMPGTQSLFGYQFRHDLADGFPLLTTKKISFKNIVVELLWFLRGDTNIKYLVDRGCNIWNEDSYGFYLKRCKEQGISRTISFDLFVNYIKNAKSLEELKEDSFLNSKQSIDVSLMPKQYVLGDCGYQYGKVWRNWENIERVCLDQNNVFQSLAVNEVDQISNVINSLRNNPESRRHIVSAVDPAHDNDLALYWCHSMFQFNARRISEEEEINSKLHWDLYPNGNYPKYHLDCHLYQRSCDALIGCPYNIASYSLLTHIIAKMCNMVPGEFIHSFGDVHIYDNHKDQVEEQLTRTPGSLPTLLVGTHSMIGDDVYKDINTFAEKAYPEMFCVTDYNPQSSIKATLSTGLIK